MSTVPRIPAESLSESMESVTPFSSPVHRGLQDSIEDLLDSSEDTMGQEVLGYIDESLNVMWEGTRDERRDWLRGQCDTIYMRMLRGEFYPG